MGTKRVLLLPMLLAGLVPAMLTGQETTSGGQEALSRQVVSGDLTIEAGERVAEVVVIGGDLEVLGEITGDATVFGGNLTVGSSGVILGDATVTGGELINGGGRVRGEMRSLQGAGIDIEQEVQEALSGIDLDLGLSGVEADANERDESRGEVDRGDDEGFLGPIGRGIGGLISTVALGLVLAGIGAALVFYGRPYLETVSDTVRGAGMRSAATGLAASFLVIPAFVVLIVALAVSIVGIPFLLVAIPLYPLAVFGAAVFGLLAVSHAVGERTAEQSRHPFDMRYRNSYAYMFTGLAMLLTPLIAASLLSMTGFLGFIGTLLSIVTWMGIWASATVGFGAVILSRAGTRRTFVPAPPDPNLFEADDLFAEETMRRANDV